MEQSATPWRVFDAPANGNETEGTGPAPAPGAAAPPARVAPGTHVAILGVIGAIVIGAIAVVVALGGSGGQLVEGPGAGPVGSGGTVMLAGGGAGDVVVDVTGAVTRPGLYHLPAGSRVGDAIDAAGGFSPRVDAAKVAEALNLAAAVTDGSQVHVPSRDDPDPATGGGAWRDCIVH